MNLKKISNQLPAKISGHHGELTIMKRNENTYYCLYPQAVKEIVPVMKGKSIEQACKKMHKALVDKNIILEEKKKKKKRKNIKNPIKRKLLNKKDKLKNRVKVQNRILKNK